MENKQWIKFANGMYKQERKEIARVTFIDRMMKSASDEAYKRLIKFPGATPEIIKKIYGFTIYTMSMMDSDGIYNAYLPHLRREIERRENNKLNF